VNLAKIFFVTVVALLAAGLAFAQIKIAKPGAGKVQPPPLFTNAILLGTNLSPNLEFKTLPEISGSSPGVYVTRPYSMMVKVPGAQPDDISIHPPTAPHPALRIIKPEMQLVPNAANAVK
jgi:hypothetical protein